MIHKTTIFGRLGQRFCVGAFLMAAAFLISCGNTSGDKPEVNLIPQPASLTQGDGVYKLKSGMTVSIDNPSLQPAAEYLISILKSEYGLSLTEAKAGERGNIRLTVDENGGEKDAYQMTVDKDGVTITGSNERGTVLGIATLRQLIPMDKNDNRVPYVAIQDEPRFWWRGMHLDVSRHFYSVPQVKDFIDLIARYKFNKFHWHLTDDQGWRVEIKQYPELTGKGAWRAFDGNDREVQRLEVVEDNPDFHIPEEFLRVENGDTLYGGYYTQDQIREVVAYAAERGIDIMPEVDMPGHFMAAQQGYPWLTCFGEAAWGESFSSPICPGKDEVVEFCKNIYSEIFSLFPYEYVHLGADEVEKINWEKCPHCQARIKTEGLKDEKELQSWFVHQMEDFFTANGKKMVGWDEILDGGMSSTATMMWWRDWARKGVPTATAAGNQVIVTPDFLTYLDFIEQPVDVRRIYDTEPTEYQPDWQLTEEQKKYIIGMQGNTWCERIPSVKRMQYQILPRMFSLSELLWAEREAKDWDSFEKRMVKHFDYLDAKGINYRIPDLTGFSTTNVFVEKATVTVESILPNIQVRYTTDGSFPSSHSTLYTGPFDITETTDFIFRGFRPDGSMGLMYSARYEQQDYAPAFEVNPEREGIAVTQYEFRGRRCERIKDSKELDRYTMNEVVIPDHAKGWLGLLFEGFVEIPADGIYTFSLLSDDGSMLYIDEELVIDNDGAHGPIEKAGQKVLAKGWHKVRVEYFDGNNGGQLRLRMAPEGGELQEMKAFRH